MFLSVFVFPVLSIPDGNRIDRLYNVHANAKPRIVNPLRLSSASLPLEVSHRDYAADYEPGDLRRARDLRGGFYSRIADIRPAVADFSRHGTLPPLPLSLMVPSSRTSTHRRAYRMDHLSGWYPSLSPDRSPLFLCFSATLSFLRHHGHPTGIFAACVCDNYTAGRGLQAPRSRFP